MVETIKAEMIDVVRRAERGNISFQSALFEIMELAKEAECILKGSMSSVLSNIEKLVNSPEIAYMDIDKLLSIIR